MDLAFALPLGELVNLLVKSKNLLRKLPLYLLVALYVGLYVLLVGLNPLDQFLNLLVPSDLELGLGVYGVAQLLHLTIEFR